MDELILRTIVIQFDGKVVKVFGASSDVVRLHVAVMREPKIGDPDRRGRCQINLGCFFGVDADEMLRLRPLLDKITAAIRAAKAVKEDR